MANFHEFTNKISVNQMDWTKFNQFKNDIHGKNVLILGLGLQGGGIGAVKFFHELGAKLRVTDLKTAEQLADSLAALAGINVDRYTFGENLTEDVDWADLVIINPDLIHKQAKIVDYVFSRKKTAEMEASLFVRLCPVEVLGITGTRGKTTTSSVVFELCKTQYPALLAGNVSGSETLNRLFEIDRTETKIVLELSSFQLRGFHWNKLSPHIAVITNIYEDHLNSYGGMEAYVADKKAIYLYQNKDDYLIVNQRYVRSYQIADGVRGKIITFEKQDVFGYPRKLTGDHNAENYAAAIQVAKLFNIADKNIRKVFTNFSGVPYRQETIRTVNGVTFVNDTTATTPTAAVVALDAFKNRDVVLVAGGNSKNCSVEEFAKKAAAQARYVVFLKGNATENFRKEVLKYRDDDAVSGIFDNFEEAMSHACSKARENTVILLSPGFTSFGMFENEFDRGRQFNEYVKKI